MTAKEYLNQAYKIDSRINSKLEQLSKLRELANKITSTYSNISGSKNNQSLQDTIAKIIDLENDINTDIDCLVDMKKDIMNTIQSLENLDYQLILEKRYLSMKGWEQIAVDLGYDLRWVQRLHKKALTKIIFDH